MKKLEIKPSSLPLIVSIILCIILFASSTTLFFYVRNLQKEITTLKKKQNNISNNNQNNQLTPDNLDGNSLINATDLSLCGNNVPGTSDDIIVDFDGAVYALYKDIIKDENHQNIIELCKKELASGPNSNFVEDDSGVPLNVIGKYHEDTNLLEVNRTADGLSGFYKPASSTFIFPTLPAIKKPTINNSLEGTALGWASSYYTDGIYGYHLISPLAEGGCESSCAAYSAALNQFESINSRYIFRSDGKTVKLPIYGEYLELTFEYDGEAPEYIIIKDGEKEIKRYVNTSLFK